MAAIRPRNLLRPALAGTLMIAALCLWLASGTSGQAASANQTQGISAAVAPTISWGTAGACTQNMPAYSFATLGAGTSAESSVFTACITSNSQWSVGASMTTAATNAAESATLDGSSFVGRVTTLPTGATTACNATNTTCTLDQSRALVTGAAKSQNSFQYKYNLNVPAAAAGGSYTGGVVTFVASN